jgi:hypothetical protein
LAQGVPCIRTFLVLCKQRLRDQYIQLWQEELANYRPGTRMYNYVKATFDYSEHLRTLDIPKYRHGWVRFLAGNHNLPIVTGRWLRRPIAERLCPSCHVVGDEFHFVMVCTRGNLCALRRKYIDPYFITRPSMVKFVQLLCTENKRALKNLSVFVYKGLRVP